MFIFISIFIINMVWLIENYHFYFYSGNKNGFRYTFFLHHLASSLTLDSTVYPKLNLFSHKIIYFLQYHLTWHIVETKYAPRKCIIILVIIVMIIIIIIIIFIITILV